jgi:outer membrane protein insertion porin family
MPGDQVRQAVLRLWALHIFSDVQILIDSKVGDGVYLLIKVQEYPRLERVEIEGADDVSEDDLRKELHFTNGQILTPEEIKSAQESIKRKYEEEGHLLATVKPETEPADSSTSNKVTLRFNIDEGPRVTIDHVYFTGNKAISEGDLKGQMEDIHEKSWWQIFSHPRFDKKKFADDKERVLKYYRNHGYLDAEIVSDSTWY